MVRARKPVVITFIIFLVVLLGFAAAFVFPKIFFTSFLDKNINELKHVEVTDKTDNKTITLSSTDSQRLFDILKNTNGRTYKNNEANEVENSGGRYIIYIYYSDNSTDTIYQTEISPKWVRILDTKSENGNPDYLLSNKNEEILEFINEVFEG